MENKKYKSKLINIEKTIRSQKNKTVRNMPKFVINILRKIMHENWFNEIITYDKDKFGVDFVRANSKFMNLNIPIKNNDNVPDSGRFIFVCNHPVGGPDFTAVIWAISEKFYNIKVITNELLQAVTNFGDLFLPVSVFGKTTTESKKKIDIALQSDAQLVTFPAGRVSRKTKGIIKDKEWHRSFVRFAVEYKRDVIPVFIDAVNSKLFYRIATIRRFFGIKANLELFMLPHEAYNKQNTTIGIIFGKPIHYETFKDNKTHKEWAQYVKEIVYKLKK